MRKLFNLLILLGFLLPLSVWAQDKAQKKNAPPRLETPSAWRKLTAEEFEWLLKTKGHLNPLQVIPVYNRDTFQFDMGPAHFQFIFPFR